jgi:diketogulonate reductase-like aldo/keto reductase
VGAGGEGVIATVRTRAGAQIPALGLGTWHMGERASLRRDEVNALRLGLDLGMNLIDTAEMYGDGGAEEVVAEAISGRRDEVYLVSKVLPHHASRTGTIDACEGSLRRLRTDAIDLYLLHWPGSHPVEETVAGFEALVRQGKIRHWGVSNFDVDEMAGLEGAAANQVLYNLRRRGIERNLLPWCEGRGIAVMAYSPLEQGRLRRSPGLEAVARRHGATPSQVALAWVLRHDAVVAIPKATNAEHVRENRKAAELVLAPEDLADLDRDFPRPPRDVPLETL